MKEVAMPYETIHFRDSDKIIRKKKLDRDIKVTLNYIDDVLQGTLYRGELLRQALDEMGWREEGVSLNILEGRRYAYRGMKKSIAIEGNFASFEYLLTGLARLQVGFDNGKIECGILMLTAARSEKSSLGTSKDLAIAEVEQLSKTISVPVAIALFDLGPPIISNGGEEEGGDGNGTPVHAAEKEEASESDQGA
jgi:hypothetical protein